jgi:hypothetical protein
MVKTPVGLGKLTGSRNSRRHAQAAGDELQTNRVARRHTQEP